MQCHKCCLNSWQREGNESGNKLYLTAAKRTLMLDSDRPLTILSIMFSVSVI